MAHGKIHPPGKIPAMMNPHSRMSSTLVEEMMGGTQPGMTAEHGVRRGSRPKSVKRPRTSTNSSGPSRGGPSALSSDNIGGRGYHKGSGY